MFYYVKNLQGDIVKILDEDGNEKASYVYNAWGYILSQSEDELSSINPLRYRGYVYDEDTAMYYLQSRYYDPTTGRFINADDTAFIGATGTVLSANIFTYCENNPINYTDSTGRFLLVDDIVYLIVLGTIVVSAVVITYSILSIPAVKESINRLCDLIGNSVRSVCNDLGDAIDDVIARAKTKSKSKNNEVHHIVAKKAKAAEGSRKLLKKANIKTSDSVNLISINYRLHKHLHTKKYHNQVYRLLKRGKGNKKRTLAILGVIKVMLSAASDLFRI
ncbi:MAG: AHH domain-containing protein [Ruminococcus sp.]|nr:RHS repeat-associated core domain-containing protein [Ruminococcus sp.]MDD5889427.1 AHH domain-containing protein [Ruminococcus sp.]